MTSRLIRLAIPMMGRIFHSIPLSQDILICLIIVIPAVIFYLIFIPNIQRMMNYSRILILLTISFLIVFLIACLRQPFSDTHPKIIEVQHHSQTIYQLNNPEIFPMIIPIHSQNAWITIESHDNLVLLPTLDQISRKTGYILNNRTCSTQTKCSFIDSFNRTIPFKQVELTSMNTSNNYQFTFRHLPSYQINVISSLFSDIVVHNAMIKPRTETIVDVQLLRPSLPFYIEIKIERCDLNDSPFLLSLTKTISHIVLWGNGRCQTLTDTLQLFVNKYSQ